MASQYLTPAAAIGGRLKQTQEAKEMEKAVRERAIRYNVPVPPYELQELIGKGSFGRVFKSKSKVDGSLVAVKIMDVDKNDYDADAEEKDQAIKDFINETTILNQLKDSKAKNINIIHDAFDWHSQLWIVSEYCPGGSLHTLMKAGPQTGLEEQYIIPVARELAVALKHVHDIGIIHRDVKAANILISQDGHLQLCDFGVSGVLKSSVDKRSTIIGTPYWMAPEMLKDDAMRTGYGVEVDIWAYGIAMIELATGLPPNANIVATKLHMFLDKAPRLEGDKFSPALKEFVDYCLKIQPEERPSAESLLQHPYVFSTSKRYPTTSLKSLIDRFYRWEQMGGQRMSLYTPHGAVAPSPLDEKPNDNDGWIFSTTDDFSFLSHSASTPDMRDHFFDDLNTTPKQEQTFQGNPTPFEKAKEAQAVMRGERALARLFDQSTTPYEFSGSDDDRQYTSDLPLRNISSEFSANRNTMIDLDAASDLDRAPILDTIRPRKVNRFIFEDDEEESESGPVLNQPRPITREWKFPALTDKPRPVTMEWSMAQAQSDVEDAERSVTDLAPPFRPMLKHTATEPIGHFNDHLHPMNALTIRAGSPNQFGLIDLGDADISRPVTSNSSVADSFSDATSGDPFDLDDTENLPINRTSFHRQSQSAPHARPTSQRSFRRSASEHHRRGYSRSSNDGDYEDAPFRSSTTEAGQLLASRDWEENVHQHRIAQYEAEKQYQRPLLSAPPGAHSRTSGWGLLYQNYDRTSYLRRDRETMGQSKLISGKTTDESSFDSETYNGIRSDDAESRVVNFPEPVAPDARALVDRPDGELVVAEMERLLHDFVGALRAAGGLIGIPERRESRVEEYSGSEM